MARRPGGRCTVGLRSGRDRRGRAALVRDDHLGAATPKDAYVVGPFAIVLGLAILGFALAAYRNSPLR